MRMSMAKTSEYKLEDKWSEAIMAHGWVGVPNLLLLHRSALGLTIPECYLLICLETYRWSDKHPWPSIEKLALRVGLSGRQVRSHISSIETKGLIKRIYQKDNASLYDIEPLINKLDKYAVSSRPLSGKVPPREEETRVLARMNTSSKVDAANKIQNIPIIKTADKSGIEDFASLAMRKYGTLESQRKSNDFGYEVGGQHE
jgi:DNA-binding transcriptional ArsR family regulator